MDGSLHHSQARVEQLLTDLRLRRGEGEPTGVRDGASGLLNVGIVDKALFLDAGSDVRQGRLTLETAKLSDGFYDALKKHPIPLEEAAIRALANNSAALDCYIWLAYRLHVLKSPKLVTWAALKAQHGMSYRHLFHFKQRFVGVLAMAGTVNLCG